MPTVAVLIVAGLQVPVIPFDDVVGNVGAEEFWHRGPTETNVAVTIFVITTDIVVEAPH
jgi:hypothetical protein